MEWAKAHTQSPLPIELGFSGAAHPRGANFQEFGSGDPELQRRIARRYGLSRDRVYLAGGTSLANFISIAALVDPGDVVAVEIPRYHPLAEIPSGLGATVLDIKRKRSGTLGKIPKKARLLILSSPHNPTGKLIPDEDWERLEAFAERGGIVLVDEVYRDLQRRPPRVAAARPREGSPRPTAWEGCDSAGSWALPSSSTASAAPTTSSRCSAPLPRSSPSGASGPASTNSGGRP
jgi:DNA-binding transcriptional MocR family regulator